MKSVAVVLALFLVLAGGGPFRACVQQRPLREAQQAPGWFSRQTDRGWHALASWLAEEANQRHERSRARLVAELARLPQPPEMPESDETELRTRGTYGKLPEVRVDTGHPAIFPAPIQNPTRFSWFQTAQVAGGVLRDLRRLDREIDRWAKLPPAERVASFDDLAARALQTNAELAQLAQQLRYLETWVPALERQWLTEIFRGQRPASYQATLAIQQNDPSLIAGLRDELRPRRVIRRPYLPEDLEAVRGREIPLPIATDVRDKKFLAEVEGALATHWNQSPWARERGIRFRIRWRFQPANVEFTAGLANLEQHLRTFPETTAVMTTGGLTVHVTGRALVLGPGRINPRTIAHEIGHLLGFGDCYLRTLTGQGVFGLGVLEWDNPFYPDDLMCDNSVGVPRAEVW